MKKGQFNFAWLFAIIVGGAILFLAIFGAMNTGDTQVYGSNTEIGKSISIITDPLQAGFSEGSFGQIAFRQETKIRNICFTGGFGKNDIAVATETGMNGEWGDFGGATSVYNKYIFSSEKNTGKDYYVFSKPFDFPYKVSDLIFLTSENYCFMDAPDEIADEVLSFGMPNVGVSEYDISIGKNVGCDFPEAVNVCFGQGSDCDISVYGSCLSKCDSVYDEGIVVKKGEDMNYVGSLMYAAIFSDENIYECNVERLMYRAGKIGEMFVEKADLMDARGCNTNLKGDLFVWSGLVGNATTEDLMNLRPLGDTLERRNDMELCGLW